MTERTNVLTLPTAVDEQQLTLEEVLAFMEQTPSLAQLADFDSDTQVSLLLLDSAAEEAGGDGFQESAAARKASVLQLAQPIRKQKKVYERRDPRKEIAALQNQVLRLTERLLLLQRRHQSSTKRVVQHTRLRAQPEQKNGTVRPETVSPGWIEKALKEFKRREQSELVNRVLKDALARQVRVSGALKSLLDEERVMPDFDMLSESNPSQRQLAPIEKTKVIPALYHYLEALYYNSGLVAEKLGRVNTSCMSSSRHVQHDPALGLVVELTTTTPLKCDFPQFADLLWNRVLANSVTRQCEQFQGDAENQSAQQIDSVEKHLKMILSGPQYGKVALHGVSVSRRFVDTNRVVLVLTSRVRSSHYDVELRGDSWLILCNASNGSSGSPATLFQCFYRVYADRGTAQRSPEEQQFQEFLVRAGSDKMEEHQLLVQKVLVEEFGTSNLPCVA